MSKVIGTYTGRFDVFMKMSNIKIQIISVPKQKNKIVMTGQPTLIPGFPKNINGSLLSVKKLIHDEKSLGWKLRPTKMYGVSISYQNRGSHQGGPMHNFKDNIALFSKDEKSIDKLLKFLEKHITKKKVRRTKKGSKKGGCGQRGGISKKYNSAYFIYKSGNSRKFWRIVKNGSKITTHYGRFGTLGQMTTKDYGIKVDSEYDKLIQSKKKKGYVEKHDFGDKNPKSPSSIKREYMKICNKAEKDIKLNPLRRNYDCEGILDQDDSEIKYMTGWYKDALKNKEFDFDKLSEHDKTRRKRKKTQKGGRKLKKIKKSSHNKTKMNTSRGKNNALEKLWTDMSNMKKYVYIMKDGSYQIKSIAPSYTGQRGSDFHRKYCLPMIEKANKDDSVKAILTAGNSYDGYRQLYDDVGNSSVDSVLKDYKNYWKYQIEGKLYTC